MVDTSHTPALGYVQVVTSHDAATLLPIIHAHIAPGSIHSDERRAYSRVANIPAAVASHSTVNHSVTFAIGRPNNRH